MADKPPSDWESFIRDHQDKNLPEIDLSVLKPGDRLVVHTQNTVYSFLMTGPGSAMLSTDREDRPSGEVRINGCTFGASSSIKPDRLFCGGNVEFVRLDPPKTYTTSGIRALSLIQGVAS